MGIRSIICVTACLYLVTLCVVTGQEETKDAVTVKPSASASSSAEPPKPKDSQAIMLCERQSDPACKCGYTDCQRKVCSLQRQGDDKKAKRLCICQQKSCTYRGKGYPYAQGPPSGFTVLSPKYATVVLTYCISVYYLVF